METPIETQLKEALELAETLTKNTTDRHIRYYNNNGNLHRLDGPAYINRSTPYYAFYIDGMLHRIEGPAEEDFKETWYYFLGLLHRTDGPAYINKITNDVEYWILGNKLTDSEFELITNTKWHPSYN